MRGIESERGDVSEIFGDLKGIEAAPHRDRTAARPVI